MHSLLAKCRKSVLMFQIFCVDFLMYWYSQCCVKEPRFGAQMYFCNTMIGIKSFLTNDLEKIQNNFFRIIGGIKKRVNLWITLREFKRYPLQVDKWCRDNEARVSAIFYFNISINVQNASHSIITERGGFQSDYNAQASHFTATAPLQGC